MSTRKIIGLVAAAALLGTALTACGTNSGAGNIAVPSDAVPGFTVPKAKDKGGAKNPVKVGVVGASNKQFQVLKDAALAEGIYITFQDFTDYTQPNPALATGQLDLNQFQHIVYLASYNVNNKQNLVPIGSTAIYPLGVYSKTYKSVAEIPEGATIVLPDDPTNQARGLQVLQSAGLIKLKDGTPSLFGQVADIDTAASRVKVKAIAPDQTPRALDDPTIAAAVINNDYVADTGLSPKDAIAQDDANSAGAKPFINIWVARDADKDKPLYLEIVRLAHSDAWNQALLDNSEGTGVLVNVTAAELQQVLADAQAQMTAK